MKIVIDINEIINSVDSYDDLANIAHEALNCIENDKTLREVINAEMEKLNYVELLNVRDKVLDLIRISENEMLREESEVTIRVLTHKQLEDFFNDK